MRNIEKGRLDTLYRLVPRMHFPKFMCSGCSFSVVWFFNWYFMRWKQLTRSAKRNHAKVWQCCSQHANQWSSTFRRRPYTTHYSLPFSISKISTALLGKSRQLLSDFQALHCFYADEVCLLIEFVSKKDTNMFILYIFSSTFWTISMESEKFSSLKNSLSFRKRSTVKLVSQRTLFIETNWRHL